MLESLVNPQAQIAEGYGTISLTLKDGSTVAGQFRSEKNGQIKIHTPEGEKKTIKVDAIKERTPVVSTMPPVGLILTKKEVRDVMAYLSSLR